MAKPIPFEQSMSALEAIVKQLEQGELSLAESLKQFEKGIGLVRQCQDTLTQAEQKVEMLATANAQNQRLND